MNYELQRYDKIVLPPKSKRLLMQLLKENPVFGKMLHESAQAIDFQEKIKKWVFDNIKDRPIVYEYYSGKKKGREAFEQLKWKDYASIRILDYIDNAGRIFNDQNLQLAEVVTNPFYVLWLAYHKGTGGATPSFFEDFIHLFRQLAESENRLMPKKETVLGWMDRYPNGLDERIIEVRKQNKTRILKIIIDKISKKQIVLSHYKFEEGISEEEKMKIAIGWWEKKNFHLKFAVRSADDLNEMLDYSLNPTTMKILYEAEKVGIPFFVNPYYLSLLNVAEPHFSVGSDLAIRQYVLYSKYLVEKFGDIVAWEKEDIVRPGVPNAAGWLLPSKHSVHRRYPEVSILIPATVGRACGGLCASCQRMFDFQNGYLNFNLDKLKPTDKWHSRLIRYLKYFENDSQLRDILITGGDALMSSDASLKQILDEVYNTALRKKLANERRNDGEKYAEMVRVRLGTRIPIYLPQRITSALLQILSDFKARASEIGIKQFLVQTHFVSPMEITPEAKDAVEKLISAGWTIINQLVFNAAASRRGHTAKLRKTLNDIGVLTYYTFTVKGYMENYCNFATNARAVQEQMEEKVYGLVPDKYNDTIRKFPLNAEKMVENIDNLRKLANLPFLATDRNVLNLPGVGKSLTFRVIGITRYGRRILEFDHDINRVHSPIINKMGKVIIIEPKSTLDYLNQLYEFGEDTSEYASIWGYSIGETEPRMAVYEYPEYDFEITKDLTNIDI